MSKFLIQFFIIFIIICEKVITIKVNVSDIYHVDSINRSTAIKNYIFSDFRHQFAFEFIFRLNQFNDSSSQNESWIFLLEDPVDHFSRDNSYAISVRAKKSENSIDFIYRDKFVTFDNITIFDGNWHKIVIYYLAPTVRIDIDCSQRNAIIFDKKFIETLWVNKILDKKIILIDNNVEFQKFIIYDNIIEFEKQCDDFITLISSNEENSTIISAKNLRENMILRNENSILEPYEQSQYFDYLGYIEKTLENDKNLQEECIESSTVVRGKNICSGDLIFSDDFENFDKDKWEHEIRIPLDSDDAEFVSYQDKPENCFVKDNHLIIMPTLLEDAPGFDESSIRTGELNLGSNCTTIIDDQIECLRKAGHFRILPPVVTAKIRTKKSFSFKYGRIDVRAKLPKGDWIFPQIHLEPLNLDYGAGSYKSGQMRIAYIRANKLLVDKNLTRIDGTQLSGGVIVGVGELMRDRYLKQSPQAKHLADDYHIYSLIWTNQSITLLLDWQEYGSIIDGFQDIEDIPHAYLWKKGEFMAPFDKEFYISLGVSVGGISDFPDDCKNGNRKLPKPWQSRNPKGELNFWQNQVKWQRTWHSQDIGMKVDYVKVWAL